MYAPPIRKVDFVPPKCDFVSSRKPAILQSAKTSRVTPNERWRLWASYRLVMRGTHVEGYDYVLLAPVFIDNVNPPRLPRPNELGIHAASPGIDAASPWNRPVRIRRGSRSLRTQKLWLLVRWQPAFTYCPIWMYSSDDV